MASSRIHARGADSRMLRIIAGRWRGRRWRFPELELRPTPDRVRETLFNWLQGRTTGAACLDLFAGSGALGLEALSRGAASAVFIEPQPLAARAISSVIGEWAAENASVEICTAEQFLSRQASRFELVFLDPPYDAGLLEPTAQMLTRRGWLAPDALIYVEQPRAAPPVALPKSWQPRNSGTAGAVSYHLYQHRHSGEPRT